LTLIRLKEAYTDRSIYLHRKTVKTSGYSCGKTIDNGAVHAQCVGLHVLFLSLLILVGFDWGPRPPGPPIVYGNDTARCGR